MTDPYKQADRERWLRDLLCGALIGAGAILPGVSGGVLAVVFDVYRPMMETDRKSTRLNSSHSH